MINQRSHYYQGVIDTIFFNATGQNENEVRLELVEFLKYVEHTEGTLLAYLKLIEDGIMTIEQVTVRWNVLEDEFYEMTKEHLK